jgi:hypothetical protein
MRTYAGRMRVRPMLAFMQMILLQYQYAQLMRIFIENETVC